MKIVSSVIDIKESTHIETSKINRFEQSILDKYMSFSSQHTTNHAFSETNNTPDTKEKKK